DRGGSGRGRGPPAVRDRAERSGGAGGRQRDRRDERRVAGGLRCDRGDPDGRQRLLAERLGRRLHRPVRGGSPARLTPQPVPRARATNGPPTTPSSGPASSTGPKANLCPGRRLISSTAAPTTPPSTAIPSREASSTSPPSAAEVATTAGTVLASPIPSTDGASRATRTAPMPITTASTAALRIVGRRAGWSSAIRARTTATRTVSVATHRLGSRCSRTSTQASTEAGGTYAAASASRGRRGSAITRTFQQIPRRSAAGGARLWTSGADRRRGGQICGGCPRVERTRMIRRRIHIFLAPLT